ncbi:transmembrane protein fend-like [Toxorhynchites rutilus septentrionalis]|uniref:transmembrane protein fend-like n=1 Tax=Toxorhynchites rutilus septentrionalis TaxID=329112 RepID=UPI00247AE15D|nr:transmembrane protein fend-like [Toxorhynchites rutilus septentrionalis]
MAPMEFRLSVDMMVCLLTAIALITLGQAAIPPDSGRNAVLTDANKTVDREQPVPSVANASNAEVAPCHGGGCLEKHNSKESLCSQQRDCSKCHGNCTQKAPCDRGCSHRLTLVLLQMTRNESLVTADVAWVCVANQTVSSGSAAKAPHQQQQRQCLVTWEVSGGGLMGNLLTESSNAQLSLWPETNYRVQVTCRNKHTDALVRSDPIVLNTTGATVVSMRHAVATARVTTTTSPPAGKKPPGFHQEWAEGDDDEALVQMEQLDSATNRLHSSASWFHSQLTVWPISRESQHEIIALGVFVALLTFLIILLTVVIFIKRKALEASEKELLVANEDGMVGILHV